MTDTLPGLLAAHAERTPRGVALRQKRLGIWHQITWSEYHEGVRAVAAGLEKLGLQPGEVVALIGGQRPQWLMTELGTQAAGGVIAPMFAEATPAELVELLRLCTPRFAVVEGQEQVDKLLEVRDKLPSPDLVLYWDPRGMRTYTDPWLRPLWEVTGQPPPVTLHGAAPSPQPPPLRGEGETVGATRSASQQTYPPAPSLKGGGGPVSADVPQEGGGAGSPLPFREGGSGGIGLPAGGGQGERVASIIFSPGAGGAPRGVRLTHANLIAAARALVEAEGLDVRSEFVSFTPNAWIGDRAFATAAALVAGYTVNLPEEPDTVQADIQEIGPRLFVAPPLIWERLRAVAPARMEGSGWLRRRVYRGLMGVADRAAAARAARRGVSAGMRVQALIADLLICRPVRDHLGLLRVRRAYSTGAPLPEETARFFDAIGVPLRDLYLVTAASGPVSVGGRNAGRTLPGVELQLGADGEVLVRGPGVASAYQGDIAPVTLPDGWLRTGDLGRMEPDGTLTLTDRVTDVTRLSDGTEVAPAQIERRLAASAAIRHAVALAGGRPYVAALIAVDGVIVGAWAERRGITVTTFKELSQHPDVRTLVTAGVQEANAGLPSELRVQRFAILDRDLSADEGELTRLGTVRRAAVIERWRNLIDTLYGDSAAPGEGPSVVTLQREAAGVG